MDACSPASLFIFALVLQAAGTGSAKGRSNQELLHRVGETATLSLEGLQRSDISNLVWRSSSRQLKEAIAAWEPGNSLSVLSVSYYRRVTFLEKSWSLQIHNLNKADGGLYQVVEIQEPSDILLKNYTLFVFDFTANTKGLVNGTCSLHLLCEVGAGADAGVTYSWKPTRSAGPGSSGPALRLSLKPADKDASYTCTAKALGTELSSSIVPYKFCSSGSGAAGLLAGSMVKAVLGPALLLLVLRLL